MEHDNESFSASLSSVFSSHRQRGPFSITSNHTTWDDYDFTDYSNVDADDLDRLCTNWLAGI